MTWRFAFHQITLQWQKKTPKHMITVHMCVCVWRVSADKVLDSCSFRDEDDDCTYYYTVDNAKDPAGNSFDVQVLEKKGELQAAYISHLCFVLSRFHSI